MTFDDFLNRFRRIWHWSAATAIVFHLIPYFWMVIFLRFPQGGMSGLNEHPFRMEDWTIWLLRTGANCCMVSAVIAIAADVTYLIGKMIAVPRTRPLLDICLRRP